jgi:hypothetical protein
MEVTVMPTCIKCNDVFPVWMWIDGKKKNLNNRKYCIECSPFGSRNTKKLELEDDSPFKICIVCKKQFEYIREKGHRKTKCNSCHTREKNQSVKIRAVNYLGGKCSICGYKKNYSALSFHHKDITQKDFPIANSKGLKWELMQNELDKCVLLCSNCHAELHYPSLDVQSYLF